MVSTRSKNKSQGVGDSVSGRNPQSSVEEGSQSLVHDQGTQDSNQPVLRRHRAQLDPMIASIVPPLDESAVATNGTNVTAHVVSDASVDTVATDAGNSNGSSLASLPSFRGQDSMSFHVQRFEKPHSLSRILHDVDTDEAPDGDKNDDSSTSIISHKIDKGKPLKHKKMKIGYPTNIALENVSSTSIISHKIDNDSPSMNLTDSNDTDMDSMNSSPQPTSTPEVKIKRKYKIDRNNIRINKRIMSKDTEDVIRMFKKFDNEVLTNPEAKSRLLNLGFETRKRYITTFKHYIRFCCSKKLDNFFVTGELMREFYEEQFTKSSSDKPVIRLRKMDPAFSKLQEINFLVYHLPTKEIPNRHLALEYLIYKETGKMPMLKKKLLNLEDMYLDTNKYKLGPKPEPTNAPSIPSPPLSHDEPQELRRKRKAVSNEETVNYIRTSFLHTRRNIDNIVSEKLQLLHNTTMNNLVDTINSLLTGIYGQLDMFNHTIGEPPYSVEAAAQPQTQPQQSLAIETQPQQEPTSTSLIQQSEKTPIIDMNHDIYTIYQILEEWRVIEPTIESRVARWGTSWLRDEVDFETYTDRKAIVGFVDRLSQECNESDKFVIANDCDRYIRDKSILDEFISEIELDEDDLCKRLIRYRQRRT
jgi:hypothetical protein